MLTNETNSPQAPDNIDVLEVRDLHVHYGKICALRDVSFRAHAGTAVALVGRNGSGKSTLLKALAGIVERPAGRILWKGEILGAKNRRSDFAYLPQREEIDWNFPLTVRGMVEMGLYQKVGLWKRFRKEEVRAVEQSLSAMNLKDLSERRIGELSGGQQQRAFLARALAGGARVLLLDEPFTGLDTEATRTLQSLLKDLAQSGCLVLASHHDLRSIEGVFQRVLLLHTSLLAFGTPNDVLTGQNMKRAFQ